MYIGELQSGILSGAMRPQLTNAAHGSTSPRLCQIAISRGCGKTRQVAIGTRVRSTGLCSEDPWWAVECSALRLVGAHGRLPGEAWCAPTPEGIVQHPLFPPARRGPSSGSRCPGADRSIPRRDLANFARRCYTVRCQWLRWRRVGRQRRPESLGKVEAGYVLADRISLRSWQPKGLGPSRLARIEDAA